MNRDLVYEPDPRENDSISSSPTAGEMIERGDQLIQIRTRTQLMVARQRPRDLKLFERKLEAMAAEAGEDFYYLIEYRDGTVVEGPGVGLARAAASLYTNCAVETRPIADHEDHWIAETAFVDFENNFTRTQQRRISKLVPTKGGFRKPREHELEPTFQRGASKVERDTILRAMPAHIIARCFMLAKAADAMSQRPLKEQIARLYHKATENEISLGHIEKWLGHPFREEALIEAAVASGHSRETKKKDEPSPAEAHARDRLATLRGILTAIVGGQITIDEAFGDGKPAPTPTETTGEDASVASFSKKPEMEIKKTEPKREPEPERHEPEEKYGPAW